MRHSPEEIGKKLAALRLWSAALPFNWAVCPMKTALPYFCSILEEKSASVSYRFLMLEGWQTLHDYVRTRADRNFGFYSAPMEFPGYELMFLDSGEVRLFRHDPGYVPVAVLKESERELVAKIIWESYGLFLRLEGEPKLPICYAGERAVFARVEGPEDEWTDRPLVIPDPPPYVENVLFDKEVLRKAKDLPFAADESIDLDFGLVPKLMTQESRPRCVYALRAVDSVSGVRIFDFRVSVSSRFSLRGLWESMPQQLLTAFVGRGRIPGRIRVCSGRVFRFLRPLCLEFPLRLSLHDALQTLDGKNGNKV